jgi:hypothetical protein
MSPPLLPGSTTTEFGRKWQRSLAASIAGLPLGGGSGAGLGEGGSGAGLGDGGSGAGLGLGGCGAGVTFSSAPTRVWRSAMAAVLAPT